MGRPSLNNLTDKLNGSSHQYSERNHYEIDNIDQESSKKVSSMPRNSLYMSDHVASG